MIQTFNGVSHFNLIYKRTPVIGGYTRRPPKHIARLLSIAEFKNMRTLWSLAGAIGLSGITCMTA